MQMMCNSLFIIRLYENLVRFCQEVGGFQVSNYFKLPTLINSAPRTYNSKQSWLLSWPGTSSSRHIERTKNAQNMHGSGLTAKVLNSSAYEFVCIYTVITYKYLVQLYLHTCVLYPYPLHRNFMHMCICICAPQVQEKT